MNGPSTAATVSAVRPTRGRTPSTSQPAAPTDAGPKATSSQEPTLNGEVGLKTRSML